MEAEALSGSLSSDDRKDISRRCDSGEIRILYVTPEFIINNEYLLRKLKSSNFLVSLSVLIQDWFGLMLIFFCVLICWKISDFIFLFTCIYHVKGLDRHVVYSF